MYVWKESLMVEKHFMTLDTIIKENVQLWN